MNKPMTSFLEFCREISGYTFHSKKTGYQIFRYQMYWRGLTPIQCFNMYDTKKIDKKKYKDE